MSSAAACHPSEKNRLVAVEQEVGTVSYSARRPGTYSESIFLSQPLELRSINFVAALSPRCASTDILRSSFLLVIMSLLNQWV